MAYRWAGFGPKYLKIRTVKNKSGISEFYVVKKEAKGKPPLYETITLKTEADEKASVKKKIEQAAELLYAKWISSDYKPQVVKEADEEKAKEEERAEQEKEALGPTFADLAEIIEGQVAGLSREYQRKVPYHIKRLREYFDKHCPYIKEWNANKWVAYKNFRRRKDPTCQLNHDRAQLKKILLYAYHEGHLSKPPVLKNFDFAQKHGRELEEPEIAGLYKHSVHQVTTDGLDLGLRNAFRLIDILNLSKDRVDFAKNRIIFKRGRRSDEGGHKNQKPVEIEINPVVREMLLRRLKETEGSPYFFPSPKNPKKPMSATHFYKYWYKTCEKAKVKDASPHDMRHTCATLMARAGIAQAFTEQFCRMSPEVVRRIYTHLGKEDNQRAANVVSKRWG